MIGQREKQSYQHRYKLGINFDRYDTIATRVDPGNHTVTVKTTRDGMFMVAGVFVGAPDTRVNKVMTVVKC